MNPNSILKISPTSTDRVISKKLACPAKPCAKPGFALFEFAISMMISTMLMTAAFTIYNQVNKAAATVQRITTMDKNIMILRDRLSTDFQGISPLWFTPELYEKLKNAQKTDATKSDAKNAATKTPTQDTKNKRNNFLYAQSTDNRLDFLTFVTTNSLQMYGDNTIRFVRVVYTLIPEVKNAKSYKLMRKEDKKPSADFDIEKMKEGTFYELANNITKLSIEYGYIDQSKKEDQGKKLSFTWTQQWGNKKKSEQKDDTKKDDETPDLPEAIKIKISLLHDPEKPEFDYEIFFMIPINQEHGLKSFAEKRAQDNKAKSPTSTGGSPTGAPPTGSSPGGAPIAHAGNQPIVGKIQMIPFQPAANKPGGIHA